MKLGFPMIILQYGVHTGIIGKIQLPCINKWDENADTDNRMYRETESKPSQKVTLIENECPEEELDFANHQLISMLGLSFFSFYSLFFKKDFIYF